MSSLGPCGAISGAPLFLPLFLSWSVPCTTLLWKITHTSFIRQSLSSFPFSFFLSFFYVFFYPLSLTARDSLFGVCRFGPGTLTTTHPPAPFSNALVPFVLILPPNPRSFRYRLHLDYTIYRKKPENKTKVQSPRETPSTSPTTSTNRQAYNYRPSSYKINASTTRACSTSRKPVAISKGEAFCEVDCE